MTEPTYLLTEVQRGILMSVTDVLSSKATELLQSLPMVSGEAVAYRLSDPEVNKKHHYFDLNEVEQVKHVLEALYTSPQPLQTITADAVTDEMVRELFNLGEVNTTTLHSKRTIATFINVFIKNRSEAR